jgi:hypothetical protein
MDSSESIEQAPLGTKPSVPLDTLSMRRASRVICRLGSSLGGSAYRQDDDKRVLAYRFDVAGEALPFHPPTIGGPIKSIADRYPGAARYE